MKTASLSMWARGSFAAALLLTTAAWAGDPKCVFKGQGAGGLAFEGKTQEVSARTEGENVSVQVVLKSLDTGIALRDRHMKEKYLEVDKFPNAVLTVARADLKFPVNADTQGEATGTFTLHGKSKQLPFKYKASKGPGGISVSCTLHLNFGDFGIAVPSYLGITVRPDVDVEAQFTLAS